MPGTVELEFVVDGERLLADGSGPPWTVSDLANWRGLVVMAPGCGGDRFGQRNRAIAAALLDEGYSVVCTDLRPTYELRDVLVDGRVGRDSGLLAHRLATIVGTLAADERIGASKLGLFGCTSGAEIVCSAATRHPDLVGGVVALADRFSCPSTDVPVLAMPADEWSDVGRSAEIAKVVATWLADRLTDATAGTAGAQLAT